MRGMLVAILLTVLAIPVVANEGPGKKAWGHGSPDAHGLSRARLEAAAEQVRAIGGRQGLVIVKDGLIVFERYWANEYHRATPEWRNVSFSSGKSWGSAMVGVAVQEGLLRVDDLASRYKPSDVSGLKPEVTIRHLLTMSSGGTLMTKPSSQRPPKLSDALRPPGRGLDYVRLNEPEPGTPPGYGRTIPANSIFYYDGVPADHLADIVSSASGMRSIDYITRRLLQPIGVENVNYQPEGVDSNGNIRIGGSIILSVRDMARLGQLWLNGGRWDGRQLVSADYVRQSIAPSPLNPTYGFLWWLNGTGRIPDAPCSMFNAAGAFGQYVFVVPDARLVVATMGFDAARSPRVDADLWRALRPALGTARCQGPVARVPPARRRSNA